MSEEFLDCNDLDPAGATDFLYCTEKGPTTVVKAHVGIAGTVSSARTSYFSHCCNADNSEQEKLILDHGSGGVNPSYWGGLGGAEQFASQRSDK